METKVEFSPGLWERVVEAARAGGFASAQHYVTDLVERAVGPATAAPSDAEITRKMEDLGYLDFGRDI